MDAKAMNESQTILIELYWHRDRLHTFVVTPGSPEPQAFSIPLSSARLREYVTSFQMAFARNDAAERESGAWMDLATTWLEDRLGDLIRPNRRIVFVPHGTLHHVPLHLLPFNETPLAMTCPVSYCPSSTLLVDCRNRSGKLAQNGSTHGLLAIGVEFEDEARMVQNTVPGSSLWLHSERPIEKSRLLGALPDLQWLHFSGHGVFDAEDPMRSGLFLESANGQGITLEDLRKRPSSFLTAAEISASRMNAALVTLSACETAQTQDLPGDELLGLIRAFFLAGTAAVLVSFWPVPAEPTQDFMRYFYGELVSKQVSFSEAAQAAYVNTAKLHPDPFCWGGFALVGDGLSRWKLN